MRTGIMVSVAVLLLSFVMLFLHWNNKSIVITDYVYENGKLPKAFEGYRVTQVSDLQSEYFGKHQKNLIEKVEKTNPDIIVYTGDLLDRNHTNFDAAEEAMKGLLKIAPVYYINGNHEMAVEEHAMEGFYEKLAEMGVVLLFDCENKIEKDGETISLLGLSEHTVFSCKGFVRDNSEPLDMDLFAGALKDLRQQAEENAFAVLLAHEPQYLEEYA